ncbi:fibrobacter succinogenes major paralogous domain-containing protein [Fibrobacter sp. UWB7]|uniref:fibrobacter succinogenes major paralogous domain-containing protein n=1 Tax=Fibrobacter sp. UWB7 TaxID=1896206 RepID=UPI001FCCCAC1|nr:fibrobacter succinogenes major paralogous domain-containing protein [Fibrobacter sp. UWB7]
MSLRGGVAVAAVSGLLLLAACGGDSGTSAPNDNGISSSEEIQSSSSSLKVESSSSVILSGDSHEESSSSTDSLNSSSSSSEESSSGVEEVSSSSQDGSSSSSSAALNCSVLLEGETGWSWDVPKECRFNSGIAYDSMTDPRDGQIYKTVKIGDHVWMAENLNYADSVKTPSLLKRSWCYNNKAENCAVAGRLYTWAAAIDSVKLATDADNPQDCGFDKTWNCTLPAKVQGICPDGWHLPTETEWKTLFAEVGGELGAGKILKAQTGWNGTDSVGFSALPAGGRDNGGQFGADGNSAYFWCSNSAGSFYASYMSLDYTVYAGLEPGLKDTAFSVRCLKDL